MCLHTSQNSHEIRHNTVGGGGGYSIITDMHADRHYCTNNGKCLVISINTYIKHINSHLVKTAISITTSNKLHNSHPLKQSNPSLGS